MSFEVKTRANGIKFVQFAGQDGARQRVSLGTRDEETAQAKARDIYIRHFTLGTEEKKAKAFTGLTFGDALDMAENDCWHRDMIKSDSGYASMVSDVRILREHLGAVPLIEMTTERMRQYREDRRKDGLAYSTIRKHLTRIGKVLTLSATQWRDPKHDAFLIPYRPALPSMPKPQSRDRVVSFAEEERLVQIAAQIGEQKGRLNDFWMLARAIEFAIDTAMRKGEQLALVPEWVYEDEDGELFVRIPAAMTKTDKSRDVPLYGRTLNTVKHLLECRTMGQPLFDMKVGKLGDMWSMVRDEADLMDIHWHDLRHTACTRWRDQDIPLDTIARLAGHDIRMTYEVYDKPNPERLRRELTKDTNVVPMRRTGTNN